MRKGQLISYDGYRRWYGIITKIEEYHFTFLVFWHSDPYYKTGGFVIWEKEMLNHQIKTYEN